MDIRPSLAALREMARGYAAAVVYTTLPAAVREPLELFRVLRKRSRNCFLLESREDTEGWGRYSFLGFDPSLEFTCKDGEARITAGATLPLKTSHPASAIRDILRDYQSPRLPELPPFTGGLVGYFGYDYIHYIEPTLELSQSDDEGFQDVDLMLFEKVLAYDRLEGLLYLIVNVRTSALEENYHRAVGELEALSQLVATGEAAAVAPLTLEGDFEPLFDEARYCAMVETAKHHIREGDIFQVVLSNRLTAPARGSLFDCYQVLAKRNPSPYLFYFASDHIELVGASPETLVKLSGRRAFTFPLAGTRPRGATPEADLALERELLNDAKELAEHNMLVDLGRNDLGKVATFGTVEVARSLDVERFSHVMHIGSTVEATVREDADALDLIDAILPAGTLSGAPKYRACELIAQLEAERRGVYGGAIGYLAFNGDLDTCIAIRLAFMRGGKVFVRSGAGIVADSVPAREYAECNSKMAAVLEAVHKAAQTAGEKEERLAGTAPVPPAPVEAADRVPAAAGGSGRSPFEPVGDETGGASRYRPGGSTPKNAASGASDTPTSQVPLEPLFESTRRSQATPPPKPKDDLTVPSWLNED
jgi:anthranilate synthase component 1